MRKRWIVLAGLGLLWIGLAAGLTTSVRAAGSAPSRPGTLVRLGGVEYVEAVEFGARFGLQPQLRDAGRKLLLKSASTSIELEADTRECSFNGLRAFLGNPVRIYKGSFVLGRIDADKFFAPILVPGAGEKNVPDLKVIMLDPGHGGKDPGKENHRLGLNEKTLTLDTAFRLKKILEQAGYTVRMTRTEDRQLGPDKISDLQRRAELARAAGADLFISLHFNAVENGVDRVTGVEVYSLTPQYQYSTADPEHDDDRGAAEANPGNTFDHWSTVLAYQVDRAMLRNLRTPDRGLKRARWAVLRYAACPAILIESGFLSNNAEARKLATAEYRQKIAEAIADGVQAYGNVLAGVRRQKIGR
ncbi:MAG: N-acetylmuramoyl-L-alanine amidase [Opitutales bacterium]